MGSIAKMYKFGDQVSSVSVNPNHQGAANGQFKPFNLDIDATRLVVELKIYFAFDLLQSTGSRCV